MGNRETADMTAFVLAALASAVFTGLAVGGKYPALSAGIAVAYGLLSLGALARYIVGGPR